MGTGSSTLLTHLAGKAFEASLSQDVFACAQHWDNGGVWHLQEKFFPQDYSEQEQKTPSLSLPTWVLCVQANILFWDLFSLHFTLKGLSIRALLKSDSVTQEFVSAGCLFSAFSHFGINLMPVLVNWNTPRPCFPRAEHLSVQLLVFMAGFTGVILQENKCQSPMQTGWVLVGLVGRQESPATEAEASTLRADDTSTPRSAIPFLWRENVVCLIWNCRCYLHMQAKTRHWVWSEGLAVLLWTSLETNLPVLALLGSAVPPTMFWSCLSLLPPSTERALTQHPLTKLLLRASMHWKKPLNIGVFPLGCPSTFSLWFLCSTTLGFNTNLFCTSPLDPFSAVSKMGISLVPHSVRAPEQSWAGSVWAPQKDGSFPAWSQETSWGCIDPMAGNLLISPWKRRGGAALLLPCFPLHRQNWRMEGRKDKRVLSSVHSTPAGFYLFLSAN